MASETEQADDFVLKVCIQCLRQIWRRKALLLLLGCIVYPLTYFAILTMQAGNSLPPGRALGVGSLRGYIRDEDSYRQTTAPYIDSSFSFHRDDLRLQFKQVSSVDDNDTFYDNKDKFTCTQPILGSLKRGATEDLWCMHRPAYLPELKNPCFRQQMFKNMFSSPTVHCLPYFHILGADKCGTTDFHSRLMGHPHILANSGGLGKEIYYWCWLRFGLFMKGTMRDKWYFQWYTQVFHNASQVIVRQYSTSKKQLITGDGTPMDLWDFRGWQIDPQNQGLSEPRVVTPHAMRHVYRDPRFFVLMRDPVERLYSDYVFLGYGFSAAKFAADVPVAIAMMRDCLKVNTTRQCFFSDDMYHKMPMRLHISCYSIFIREWLSVFPRRNFFFLRTEDYHDDVDGTLRAAFNFLGVDPLSDEHIAHLASRDIRHQTVLKKKAGPIRQQTRKLLEDFYSRFNEDLAELLGDKKFLWKNTRNRKHAPR